MYLKKKIAIGFNCLEEIIADTTNKISKLQESINIFNNRINDCNNLIMTYKMDIATASNYNNSDFNFGIGGNAKITKTIKKEILGKERCIYKKSGDRKEYVKHKGDLITVSEYKKIMAAKNKK